MTCSLNRKALQLLVAAFIAGVVFIIVSIGTTFKYWPWTVTNEFRTGAHYGFKIGEPIENVLSTAIQLQKNKSLGTLYTLKTGVISSEQYVGNPADMLDLERVSKYDQWFINYEGCNCWLVLKFQQGNLIQITHKLYRGPTE